MRTVGPTANNSLFFLELITFGAESNLFIRSTVFRLKLHSWWKISKLSFVAKVCIIFNWYHECWNGNLRNSWLRYVKTVKICLEVSKNILSIRRTTYLSRLRSSRGVSPCIFDAIHEDICLRIVSLVFESLRISATNPSVFFKWTFVHSQRVHMFLYLT